MYITREQDYVLSLIYSECRVKSLAIDPAKVIEHGKEATLWYDLDSSPDQSQVYIALLAPFESKVEPEPLVFTKNVTTTIPAIIVIFVSIVKQDDMDGHVTLCDEVVLVDRRSSLQPSLGVLWLADEV